MLKIPCPHFHKRWPNGGRHENAKKKAHNSSRTVKMMTVTTPNRRRGEEKRFIKSKNKKAAYMSKMSTYPAHLLVSEFWVTTSESLLSFAEQTAADVICRF